MQDFLDAIIKSPKNPLTSSMLGLIGKSEFLVIFSLILLFIPSLETKHEGCMDFGEFVEVRTIYELT